MEREVRIAWAPSAGFRAAPESKADVQARADLEAALAPLLTAAEEAQGITARRASSPARRQLPRELGMCARQAERDGLWPGG